MQHDDDVGGSHPDRLSTKSVRLAWRRRTRLPNTVTDRDSGRPAFGGTGVEGGRVDGTTWPLVLATAEVIFRVVATARTG